MVLFIDKHKFRVVCQKCGITGIIDFTKNGDENGFHLKFSAQHFLDELEETEYYLCGRCHNELSGFIDSYTDFYISPEKPAAGVQ